MDTVTLPDKYSQVAKHGAIVALLLWITVELCKALVPVAWEAIKHVIAVVVLAVASVYLVYHGVRFFGLLAKLLKPKA